MKKDNLFLILTILLVSYALWASAALAGPGDHHLPDVSALTIEEAEAKYGVGSGYEHPLLFEVNTELGPKNCVSIGPDCSKACPTPKIYYQSPHHYLNRDGSSTIRVDIYFDNNETITSRDPSC
ncbi:MAG: hypothetical protein WGN25_09940 [Candidatus Electrothrix sp. GW3-4]|uniref:hypothetical protein n=1 Tax=Candidatus Electrothrix sp. GW3-4 TaxID=3126740 RepID=UPI0030D34652